MQTNSSIPKDSKLYNLGQALIDAGHEYWKEYQHTCNPSAVVWLEMDNGNFILFTRGEYKGDIMQVVTKLQCKEPSIHIFTD